ncbi:MAG: type II toxin-antitoxin system RelE/ParE family toxin [Spirulinaceae cyanobacterium]
MNISFDPLAAQEFKTAFDYYESQETGLGEQFRQALWSALAILERYPEVGQEVRPRIRKMLIKRFPYKLIYTVNSDLIYVLAVAHGYREPNYWIERAE